MTQEDKEQLLTYLTALSQYNVHCIVYNMNGTVRRKDDIIYYVAYENVVTVNSGDECYMYYQIKPYLRPLSSMTTEERNEWADAFNEPLLELEHYEGKEAERMAPILFSKSHTISIDWLNKHHFDYRGLIDKGLALDEKSKKA